MKRAAEDAAALLAEGRGRYHDGLYVEAQSLLEEALGVDPFLLEARLVLAIILARSGRLDHAGAHLSHLLSEDADNCDALVWMAYVKRAENRWQEALGFCRRAVQLRPEDAATQNMLGLLLLSERQAAQAAKAFEKAVALEPTSAATFHNLGLALRLCERMRDSAEAFKRAAQLAPDHEEHYYELYQQLQILAEWEDAAHWLVKAVERHPSSVILILALANVYAKLRDPFKAEEAFRRAVAIDPSSSQSYGMWLQFEGRFDEAAAVFERSIQLRPVQGLAYFGLAESNRFGGLIERMLPLLTRQDLDDESRMYLCYALGKSYDNAKVYDRAMQFFDEANTRAYAIYNSVRGFDREITKGYPDKVARIYSPGKLEGIRELGSNSERPVFIVGMIRSGTTLLDQIVTSHPDAMAAGELDYWKLQADRFNRQWFRDGIDASQIGPMADVYLKLLLGVSKTAARITDKMPINYESIGLIHLVFPKAKILHIRRNPLDTCLSIYMTYYGGGPNFAYNQENIIAYYRAYLRFMELWREVVPPENLLEIDYEDLVGKPESLIREVLAFCGLQWDPVCLDHQRNKSSVATPSTWQARQPIYKTSVERWRRYEPWLGELLELKDLRHPAPSST